MTKTAHALALIAGGLSQARAAEVAGIHINVLTTALYNAQTKAARNQPRATELPGYDGRGASKALLLAIARVRNKGGERALALNKMAIDEDGLVEREQARELDATRFDEWGTPDRKLPNCPRCDEDELFADGLLGRFSCYRCGWTREQAREQQEERCDA